VWAWDFAIFHLRNFRPGRCQFMRQFVELGPHLGDWPIPYGLLLEGIHFID
jgi:hypothetical protein